MPRNLLALAALAWPSMLFAQSSEVSIESPPPPRFIGPILRPFHLDRRIVAQPTLTNSSRLESLLRGGNLYLSVQDVIALVLENNLDIAIQRYGPFLAREVQRRAEGGGILRSVDSPVLPGPISVSLTGVSTASSGLAGGAGVGSIGTVAKQVAAPPNLDPYISAYANVGHYTSPQTNTLLLNETTALTNDFRQYQVAVFAAVHYRQQHRADLFHKPQFLQQPGQHSESRAYRIPGLNDHATVIAGIEQSRKQSRHSSGQEQRQSHGPSGEASSDYHDLRRAESVLGPGEFH